MQTVEFVGEEGLWEALVWRKYMKKRIKRGGFGGVRGTLNRARDRVSQRLSGEGRGKKGLARRARVGAERS